MIKELIINYHLTEMSVNKIKYKFINYDQLFNVKKSQCDVLCKSKYVIVYPDRYEYLYTYYFIGNYSSTVFFSLLDKLN